MRGENLIYNYVNDDKENLTVLVTGNAARDVAPPMVVYRYKRTPESIAATTPKGWGIGCPENGWMTSDTFYCYIANMFYTWAKEKLQFPIVLFVDGHVSHLTYHLSTYCKSVEIILIALYPNATHLLQPMDVAVFRTLKSSWKEEVMKWRI